MPNYLITTLNAKGKKVKVTVMAPSVSEIEEKFEGKIINIERESDVGHSHTRHHWELR